MGPRLRGDDTEGVVVPYYVYILASRRYGTLYTGITNDLSRRLEQHRLGFGSEFVREYKVHRLVHIESLTIRNLQSSVRSD